MEKEVLAAGFTPKIVLVYNIHTHTHTGTHSYTLKHGRPVWPPPPDSPACPLANTKSDLERSDAV